MPIYLTGQGEEVQVIDKTRPRAAKDYQCCWASDKPHIIPKGSSYVRVVYKKEGKFESDHICLDCWCGIPENSM